MGDKKSLVREWLEGELETNLTDTSNLKMWIPVVLTWECENVKALKELCFPTFSVIDDGTKRYGENIAIVCRMVRKDTMQPIEVLAGIPALEGSVNGQTGFAAIIEVMQRRLGFQMNDMFARMRDCCSVNDVTHRCLKMLSPNIIDGRCLSHTSSNAGAHLETPTLDRFIVHWHGMFKNSDAAEDLFKEEVGARRNDSVTVRWWSFRDEIMQLFEQIGGLPGVAERVAWKVYENGRCPATSKKMLEFLDDHDTRAELVAESAGVVLGAEALVNMTFSLEGNEALALVTYEEFEVTKAVCQEGLQDSAALTKAVKLCIKLAQKGLEELLAKVDKAQAVAGAAQAAINQATGDVQQNSTGRARRQTAKAAGRAKPRAVKSVPKELLAAKNKAEKELLRLRAKLARA